MAPAVEIDPRLLRQLEEEYESLKNDAERPRVDFEKWIRQRLKEAKAAGLVRLAKGSPASHTLKAAAAAQAAGMAPPKTAFGFSYNPNKYTRRSTDVAVVKDTAGAVSKGKPGGDHNERRGGVKDTTAASVGSGAGGAAAYVPLVFKPRSPTADAGAGSGTASKSPSKSRPPRSEQQQHLHHQQQQPSSRAEAARRQSAAASAAAMGRDPNLPWFAQRPSSYATPGTADQPLVLGSSKAAWDNNNSYNTLGGTGGHHEAGTGVLKPGPSPAADSLGHAPAVLAAAEAAEAATRGVSAQQKQRVPEGMSKTVQGVGDRVRRMAEAVALAQKDMASGRSLEDKGKDLGGGGGDGGGEGVGGNTGGGAGAASSAAAAAKNRELQALQKQQKALQTKNKELEEALKLQVKRAAEQERRAAAAKKAAAAAKAEMMALIERKELKHRSESPSTAAAAADPAGAAARGRQRIDQQEKASPTATIQSAAAAAARRPSYGPGGVRASFPAAAVDRGTRLSQSSAAGGGGLASVAPRTLGDAAAELLGDSIVDERVRAEEEREARERRGEDRALERLKEREKDSAKRQEEEKEKEERERRIRRRELGGGSNESRAAGASTARRRSPVKPKGSSFLDRISSRRERAATAEAASAGGGGGGGVAAPGSRGRPAWNDSPDMVATIAGPAPPPPPRRRAVAPPPPPKYARVRGEFSGGSVPAGGVTAARRRQADERARAAAAAAASKTEKASGSAAAAAAGSSGTAAAKAKAAAEKGDKDRDRALREAALKLLEAEVGRVLPSSSSAFVPADGGPADHFGPDDERSAEYSSDYSPKVKPSRSTTTNAAAAAATAAPRTPGRKAALTKSAAAAAAAGVAVGSAAAPPSNHHHHNQQRDPLQGPATGLMTLSTRPDFSHTGGGDSRAEIAAMRTILDEVVAHLRLLHMASGVTADQLGATAGYHTSAKAPNTPKSKSRKSAKSSTAKSKLTLDFDRLSRGGGGGGGGFTTGSDDVDDDDRPVSSSSPTRGRGSGSGSGGGSGSDGVGGGRRGASSTSFASSSVRLSGALVLSSLEHSRALEALREVEKNELAMRAKWGLFSPKHPPPRKLTDEENAALYRKSVVLGEAGVAAIEAEVAAASASSSAAVATGVGGAARHTAASVAAAIAAKSLATAGAEASRALIDEDTVGRVWEARNQFLRYQSLVDDAVVSEGGPDGDFSPVEVNEEVAERLLDALLTDLARELCDACDEATDIVLQHEFEGGDGGGGGGLGRYGAGDSLIDDDVVGAAIARAYL